MHRPCQLSRVAVPEPGLPRRAVELSSAGAYARGVVLAVGFAFRPGAGGGGYPETRHTHAWIGLPSSKRGRSPVKTAPPARRLASRRGARADASSLVPGVPV